ncbi:MAG: ABC transporter substrate-binding protein [Bacteriovoracaceae bacterium]|nr:ABC transporter substrate-binding protein [Bacteriovoracaceae bacterium]
MNKLWRIFSFSLYLNLALVGMFSFAGEEENAQLSLVALGPNQVGALKLLGKLDQVKAYGQKRWAFASEIQDVQVVDLGYPPSLEQLIRLKPSLVLVNGGPWAVCEGVPWMEKAGLPLFTYLDFLEPHPLGRLAWAKVLGKKLGVGPMALQRVEEYTLAYQQIQQKTQELPATQRPLVLLGSLQGDTWVAPAGGQWMAHLIEDAGGQYLWANRKQEVRLPWEQVLRLAKDVAYWIPLNHWQQAQEIMASDTRYALLKIKRGRIINNNQRLNALKANDFWESGLYHPHELLAELQQILHPELGSRLPLKWWRPL